MGKYLSVLGGIVAVVVGIALLVRWWDVFIRALQATVPAVLILIGLIMLFAGISEIKDTTAQKSEEKK